MRFKNYFFVWIIFIGSVYAMEEVEKEKPEFKKNNRTLNQSSWRRSLLGFLNINEKVSDQENNAKKNSQNFFLLNIISQELIEYIGDILFIASDVAKEAIKNHCKFALVLLGDKRFDIRKSKYEYIKLSVKYFKVNPFILARRIKINLSNESKKNFRDKLIEKELERKHINPNELEQWLSNQEIKNYGNLFHNLMQIKKISVGSKIEKNLIIGLLALLKIGVDPDIEDRNGMTVLMKTVDLGYDDLTKMLIRLGARPDNRSTLLSEILIILAITYCATHVIKIAFFVPSRGESL